MARGTLYLVSEELDEIWGIEDENEAALRITNEQIESFSRIVDTDKEIQELVKRLNGTAEKKTDPEGRPYFEVVFPEGCASEYFKERFEKFKKLSEKITLKDFSSNTYQLEFLLNDSYADAVYNEYDAFYTLDSFVRSIVPDFKYYFYNAVIMR